MGCSEPPWRCTVSKRDVVSDRCAAERATMGRAAKPRKCWSGWYEGSYASDPVQLIPERDASKPAGTRKASDQRFR